MCFLQPQRVFPSGRGKSQKSEDLDADFQFSVVLTDLTKIMDKPLKKMPHLPDFLFQVFAHTFLSKFMERRKLQNPHQGMCFLQPQRVFPHGRGKSQKSEDLDADFQFFVALTDLTKIMDKPLKKMPHLPNSFFQGFVHTFFFKNHGTTKT